MWYLISIVILLGLSAFFSGAETALFSLSNVQARTLLKEKGKKRLAQLIIALKRNPKRLIVAILIGNNLVNISASVLATLYFTQLLGSKGPAVALGLITFLVLVLGEIIPKSSAALAPKRASCRVARPVQAVMYLLWPFVLFFEFIAKISGGKMAKSVSEEEVKIMMTMAVEAGTIEEEEQELIERVFQFNDVTAEDVMTPRTKMFCLKADLTLEEALPRIIKSPFTRIPIYEKSLDNIVGILYTRDCLKYLAKGFKNLKLSGIAKSPFIVPCQKIIDDLFREFQLRHVHIAVVVDEYGGVVGLVTLEDLLEELVGEIIDESDVTKQLIKRIDKNTILADGETEINQINNFFNIELPGKVTDPISGLIFEKIGRIPKKGEEISFGPIKLIIEEVTKKKIIKIKIIKQIIK